MDMAQFLKQNGTEDFKVYSDTMCAIYRGVRLQNCFCSGCLCLWALCLHCHVFAVPVLPYRHHAGMSTMGQVLKMLLLLPACILLV